MISLLKFDGTIARYFRIVSAREWLMYKRLILGCCKEWQVVKNVSSAWEQDLRAVLGSSYGTRIILAARDQESKFSHEFINFILSVTVKPPIGGVVPGSSKLMWSSGQLFTYSDTYLGWCHFGAANGQLVRPTHIRRQWLYTTLQYYVSSVFLPN